MYIDLSEIARGLQEKFSVELFNIPASMAVRDLLMLPHVSEEQTPQLERDCAYICEYRDLRFLDPHGQAVPIICIVDARSHPDRIYFSGRQAVVVYHSSVSSVLLELAHVMYVCGNRSSQILDISRELLRCSGVDELLEAAYGFLNNPLIVTDINQRIFAYTPVEKIPDSVYAKVIEMDYVPVGHPSLESANAYRTANGIPFPETEGTDLPPVLCKELTIGGSTIGFLHLIKFNQDIRVEDSYVLEMLGNLLSFALCRHPAWTNLTKEEQTAAFLRDILDNKFPTEEQLQEQQNRIGLQLKPYLRTIIIKVSRAHNAPLISLYDLSRQFAAQIPDTIGFLYRNSIILLQGCSNPQNAVSETLAPIRPYLADYHMAAGVSNVFVSLGSMRNAGYQSNLALEMGSVLSDDPILEYRDYAFYHMIDLALHGDQVENFILPELSALLDYCQKNDSTLLDTLRVYLECGCSRSATAERLYIHQNTLRYRILQIEKIMGISVKDADNPIRLTFGMQILNYAEHFGQLRGTVPPPAPEA